MFPPLTASRRPHKRSFSELVRGAVDTALEFATLGEATSQGFVSEPASEGPVAIERQVPPAPSIEPPPRRLVGRTPPRRRPGRVAPRPQACVTPVHRPALR